VYRVPDPTGTGTGMIFYPRVAPVSDPNESSSCSLDESSSYSLEFDSCLIILSFNFFFILALRAIDLL
jgi:hypothetical protein